VDVVIKLASFVITHDVTPSIVMILFFVHQQNKQSNQNKKEIEKLKTYNEKRQAEEKERQSKELENALERIKSHDRDNIEKQSIELENALERIKSHSKNNLEHLKELLLELLNKEK
jgi:response regulator RpfG family c-di-GMP phosphodiesterase